MTISGGPITAFREGWAIIPFVDKPHFWRRQDLGRKFLSACGLTNDLTNARPGIVPLEPGGFMATRCKRCSKARRGR